LRVSAAGAANAGPARSSKASARIFFFIAQVKSAARAL
jgi:hypothetical protein